MNNKRKMQGFNFIELIIVVAILGILAAIVYPVYTEHVWETRRTDAWAALGAAEADQLRWHAVNFTYTSDLDNLGGSRSPEGFYTMSVEADNASFTLTATANSDGAEENDAGCTVLTLNHIGERTPEACW